MMPPVDKEITIMKKVLLSNMVYEIIDLYSYNGMYGCLADVLWLVFSQQTTTEKLDLNDLVQAVNNLLAWGKITISFEVNKNINSLCFYPATKRQNENTKAHETKNLESSK